MEKDFICSICLEIVDNDSKDENRMIKTICSHEFHLSCIVQHIWHCKSKETRCPLCRQEFSPSFEFQLLTQNKQLFRKYRSFLKCQEEEDVPILYPNGFCTMLFLLFGLFNLLVGLNIINRKNTLIIYLSLEFAFLFVLAFIIFFIIGFQCMKYFFRSRINILSLE